MDQPRHSGPGVTPREMYSIRLSPDAVARVDALADVEKLTRSDMIRKLLSEAIQTRDAKRPYTGVRGR